MIFKHYFASGNLHSDNSIQWHIRAKYPMWKSVGKCLTNMKQEIADALDTPYKDVHVVIFNRVS